MSRVVVSLAVVLEVLSGQQRQQPLIRSKLEKLDESALAQTTLNACDGLVQTINLRKTDTAGCVVSDFFAIFFCSFA